MRHISPPVMLFAAGLGTRMAPLTADRPKPMIPVAGRPLIDHALDLLDGVDTGPVIINLHYLPRQIQDHLQGRPGIRLAMRSSAVMVTTCSLAATA